MTSQAFESFCDQRARRASVLADRYPESRAALEFYGAVAAFQGSGGDDGALFAMVSERGPEPLAELARQLDAAATESALSDYLSGEDRDSPRAFFARALLQRDRRCLPGAHLPQLGIVAPQGDGTSLQLQCALCFEEWTQEKAVCHECDADGLGYYNAPEMPHLEVRACDACRIYLNLVRKDKEADAVPDVDEIAALPLDVWAQANGFTKTVTNLVGM